MANKTKEIGFKAKAHLLKLLGDELIGNDKLAVFELVKNAYDADASSVEVTLDLDSSEPTITVKDIDGCGMSLSDIEDKWLSIGTDSKRGNNKKRTKVFNRMPLGEKGVGRLAVHKLGESLQLNTRSENEGEIEIKINWPTLIGDAEFIDQTMVNIELLENPKFFKETTGTRIKIYDLYKKTWNRGDIRSLKKMLVSLSSPFEAHSDFTVNFEAKGREKDLDGVLDIQDILDVSLWKYTFEVKEDGVIDYEYTFTPPSSFSPLKKSHKLKSEQFLLSKINEKKIDTTEPIYLKEIGLNGIGPIKGTFYTFSLSQNVIEAKRAGALQQLRTYLKDNGGVRIFRDKIRVFNYGEPGEDWLGLNADRINNPGKGIGTNTIIGAIELDLEKSFGLIEKTNREGFSENETYKTFHWISQNVIENFLRLHQSDRERVDDFIKSGRTADPKLKFDDNINKIKKVVKDNNLDNKIGGAISYIEKEYNQMRNVMTSSGLSGLNISVIFHEIEREIDSLHRAIMKDDAVLEELRERSSNLVSILESFSSLLKKRKSEKFSASEVIEKVLALSIHRFKHHRVSLSTPVLVDDKESDFILHAPFGIVQATITNIVNNSLYWTQAKSKLIESDEYMPGVGIFCLPNWYDEGPAITIVDNGDGFSIPPESAVQPFIGNRPGGMGLGLYYAKTAMESIGGRLIIDSIENLKLPKAFNGAAVSLIFKGNN
ncbi:TPA: ATP-binding protein [Serratia marcescens]|uniref:ATP-binding protein n=4 Tax=Serratia TaxID=613 RepID=UPI0029DA1CFE|nr:ATP-binding protein [Serratia marcescens]MDX7539138.1 ATP-binding protein [Serratia marcescens]